MRVWIRKDSVNGEGKEKIAREGRQTRSKNLKKIRHIGKPLGGPAVATESEVVPNEGSARRPPETAFGSILL
jgi:hypothetical protein